MQVKYLHSWSKKKLNISLFCSKPLLKLCNTNNVDQEKQYIGTHVTSLKFIFSISNPVLYSFVCKCCVMLQMKTTRIQKAGKKVVRKKQHVILDIIKKTFGFFFCLRHFHRELRMKINQLGSFQVKNINPIFTVYRYCVFLHFTIDHAMWSNFKWDISTLEWLEKKFFGLV